MNEKEVDFSIEETNKLRASLGLKPLEIGPSSEVEAAKNNFKAVQQIEIEKQKTKALQQKLEQSQEKRKLEETLQGTTLGAYEEGIDDVDEWMKKLEKIPQKIKETQIKPKKQTDLTGMKVNHSFNELYNEQDVILTLKDKGVLEDTEDQLENSDLMQLETVKKQDKLREKQKLGYDYDDLINGNKDTLHAEWFRINQVKEKPKEERTTVSLNYETKEIQNYSQDIPKKRKRTRKTQQEIIIPETTPILQNFVDDDDLQSMIALTRRKLKKEKLPTIEELAVLEHACVVPEPGSVILDSTQNFVIEIEPSVMEQKDVETNHIPMEEPTITSGIASTMELLRQKGVLSVADEETKSKELQYEQQQKWQREHAHEKGRKKEQTKFENYKPIVDIDHYDKSGAKLSPKSAYRLLSNKFHRTKPGKNKQEKLLKREQERKKKESMSLNDSSLKSVTTMLQKQKEQGAPGILLSKGK